MWSLIAERLERAFRTDARVAEELAAMEASVMAGRMTPPRAADALYEAFEQSTRGRK